MTEDRADLSRLVNDLSDIDDRPLAGLDAENLSFPASWKIPTPRLAPQTPELQAINCEDCGENLGYQAAGTAVQREMWRHNRCPERIAKQLGLTRSEYNTALAVTTLTIVGCYPDFPNNVIGDREQAVQTLRGNIAAGAILEALSVIGFNLKKT